MHPLVQKMMKKERRALARAITLVENNHEDKWELMQAIYPLTGKAQYIGVTGSPGAGKSSIVNHMIKDLRSQGKTVGVVAVDPTSPFSGGAILGDRVRMANHYTDPDVFIRSMATHGSLGGLARTTKEVVRLLDAFGFDVILIETVGVGQSELDIMRLADTTLVVLTPGSGDTVQVFKAGIMEIADIFVINKADLPGVRKLQNQINSLLDLAKHDESWRPPIVQVIATQDKGFTELWQTIQNHQNFSFKSKLGTRKKQRQFVEDVRAILYDEMAYQIENVLLQEKEMLNEPTLDPYTIAQSLIQYYFTNYKEEGGNV